MSKQYLFPNVVPKGAKFPEDISDFAVPAISRILLKVWVEVMGNLPAEMCIIPEEFPQILSDFAAGIPSHSGKALW